MLELRALFKALRESVGREERGETSEKDIKRSHNAACGHNRVIKVMNNLEHERLTEKTKKLNVMRLMNVYDCLVLCHNIWLFFFSLWIALSRLASPRLAELKSS